MTYAKFIDTETIRIAPKNYKTANLVSFNFNRNPELMKSQGFYELIEDEKPEVEEGYYLAPQYELIEQNHEETITKVVVGEDEEEQETQETITIDDTHIAVHWIAKEIVDEEE